MAVQMKNLINNGTKPWVMVSFSDATSDEIATAKSQGMDMAECRVDLMKDSSENAVKKQLKHFNSQSVPVLLTIRTQQEGGKWQGNETERLALFGKLVDLVDLVDVELSSGIREEVCALVKFHKKSVLFSQHDFTKTPDTETLDHLLGESLSLGGDVFKIATQVNTQKELHTLVQFLQDHQEENIVVIGMGQTGMVSRAFFPALGSLLTFTYLGEPTAPGQLDLPTTAELIKTFYLA